MNKFIIGLIIISSTLSCKDPLDSIYNEPSYSKDVKLIKDKNKRNSDRIIDQVKYADEIKPGATYRDILKDFNDRKELLIKIIELYEQESLKEYFNYNDYIQIYNKSTPGQWINYTEHRGVFESSIKNITDKTIQAGFVGRPVRGFTNLLPDSIFKYKKSEYNDMLRLFDSPLKKRDVILKINDSLLYYSDHSDYINNQQFNLYSNEVISELIEYYNQNNYIKNKLYSNKKTLKTRNYWTRSGKTFEEILIEYKALKKADLVIAQEGINNAYYLTKADSADEDALTFAYNDAFDEGFVGTKMDFYEKLYNDKKLRKSAYKKAKAQGFNGSYDDLLKLLALPEILD